MKLHSSSTDQIMRGVVGNDGRVVVGRFRTLYITDVLNGVLRGETH